MALALTLASDEFMFTGFETGRNFIAFDFKNLGSELKFFSVLSLAKSKEWKTNPKFVFFTAFPYFSIFVQL